MQGSNSNQNATNLLKSLHIDPKTIEDYPLEKILVDMIEILKIEVSTATDNIKACNEPDESIALFNRLLSTAEELQKHLEFTLEVLMSPSEEHFKLLCDNKFKTIAEQYSALKSKHDVSHIPVKQILMAFNSKIVREVQNLLRKCFRLEANDSVRLVKSYENVSLVTILTTRLEIACVHYPDILCHPKDDIFHHPKSSAIWQELHKSADFKAILTEEEADESYSKFQYLSNMGHIIIKNQSEYKTLIGVKSALSLAKDMVYYGIDSNKANILAHLRLSKAKMEDAFDVWNLIEQPLVSYALSYQHCIVGYDEKIYVPRLFPKITLDVIKQEYEEGTFNKIHPMDQAEFEPFDFTNIRERCIQDLFTPSEDKIPIRILAPDHLDIKEKNSGMLKRVVHKASKVIKGKFSSNKASEMDGAIIIHIHGGGFVSMSSESHKVYLNNWVQNLNLIHFSIDYRLAPQNKYPDALDDVWQGYLWITTYAEQVLGITNQKIILVGDSAGGNLCAALTLRLIRAGLKPPHACLLIYPALYIDDKSSSPSLFGSLDDTLLPVSILKLAVKAYIPEGARNKEDPFISPLVASDELLMNLPPVRIIVGSKDPLCDDSWRMLARMKKLNKDIKLVVHEHIPHGFLNNANLKHKDAFLDHVCDVIREVINV